MRNLAESPWWAGLVRFDSLFTACHKFNFDFVSLSTDGSENMWKHGKIFIIVGFKFFTLANFL